MHGQQSGGVLVHRQPLGVEVDESGTVGVIPRNDAARTPLGACTITLVQQLRFPKARERASRVHLIKYP